MILVTGSSGFVGSHIQTAINAGNLLEKHPAYLVGGPRQNSQINIMPLPVQPLHGIIHMAAISDTTCTDEGRLAEANVKQTLELADSASKAGVPFLFASSASVYGNGRGPLNAYARSKAAVDAAMANRPGQWYGLRLFNVYGKGEERKGDQASMVSKAFRYYSNDATPKFFSPDARRDYVHVSDVVKVVLWLLRNLPASGIYDVGTGHGVSIREMCCIVGAAVATDEWHKNGMFEVIDIPPHMIGKCQMDTCADLTRLRAAGYAEPFLSLSDGVKLL